MEYLDILDKNGNKTGKTVEKEEAHTTGVWHGTVRCWLLNKKRELLVQKRSQDVSHPGKWDISAAGHIKAGQTSIEAAEEETFEELGLEFKNKEFKFLFTHKEELNEDSGGFVNNEWIDTYLTEKDIDIDKINFSKDEVSRVKYIEWRNLREIIKLKDPEYLPHPKYYEKLFKYLEKEY